MWRDRRILLGIIFISFALLELGAQRNTYSPYSRYGMGEISRKGFEKSRAMGGVGLGFQDNNYINYLNPASYAAHDTLSFLFSFGMRANNTTYETKSQLESSANMQMDHLALGFPITKWWKTAFGVVPFSSVGYSVLESGFLDNDDVINYLYDGYGGINQLFLGTAFNLTDGLSIGANFSYLFGTLDIIKSVRFPLNQTYAIPEIVRKTIVHDFIYHFGIQYKRDFSEKYSATIGIVYDLKTGINAENRIIKSNHFHGTAAAVNDSTIIYSEFIIEDTTIAGEIMVPARYGLGFSFMYENKLLLGIDFYNQDWSQSSFFDQKEPLTNSNSIHAGLEFTPDPEAFRGYWKKIHYRMGGYYENSYLKLGGEQLKDYGISFGVGLPFRNTKTSFNLACELGQRGTLDNNLIKENYVIVSFSVTLHDFWFYKRKFD